jgi:HKD family nuclease
MQVNFIGHGLDPNNENTVGNLLATSFDDKKFDNFTGLVAFASISGVKKLIPHIKKSRSKFKDLTFFIGVDDNGTSKEALKCLIDNEVETYIFHTQSAMIFHPKLFLFEGLNWTRLVIGSTNLTTSGLFVNVEASISMDFRPTDSQGQKIVNQIKSYFKSLLDKSNANIELLTGEFLETLCKKGLVTDEFKAKTNISKDDELDDLGIFPEMEKHNVKQVELGNADLPDELPRNRESEYNFTKTDLEKFSSFFELWKQYKIDFPKSGGVISKETDDRPLFSWFRKIKLQINKEVEIPLHIMQQLENAQFPFENGGLVKSRIRWNERYEELLKYVEKYKMGFAHVPQHKSNKHPHASLGQWCAQQKQRRKGNQPPTWTDYEENKMNAINFKWEVPIGLRYGAAEDESWLENYFRLEDYKNSFGSANPSQMDKNPEVRKLAKWVNDQRTLRNTGRLKKNGELVKLKKSREEILKDLGVDWDWQLTKRKIELEKFIEGLLELRKYYPDEKPNGDERFKKILENKSQIKHRYGGDTSEENKWRIDRLNEIKFQWT